MAFTCSIIDVDLCASLCCQHIKTPGILLLMIVIFYVVTGFFDALGLSIITNILYIPFWLLSLCLVTWMTVKYTGNASEIGEIIDEGAEVIADHVSVICSFSMQ